jgi:hypothetical protein
VNSPEKEMLLMHTGMVEVLICLISLKPGLRFHGDFDNFCLLAYARMCLS